MHTCPLVHQHNSTPSPQHSSTPDHLKTPRSLHCSSGRSLFIHVPPLDQPYTAAQLARAIAIVLRQIVKMRT